MRPPWFTASYVDGSDASQDMIEFAQMIGLEHAAPERYSLLLLSQLFGYVKSGTQSPTNVIDAIQVLEGLKPGNGMKPATQFTGALLRGLWHQHHRVDELRSLAINLAKGLNRYGIPWFDAKVAEFARRNEFGYVNTHDIPYIVQDIISGNLKRLTEQQALTGEWLVFAKHKGRNFYLCVGTHLGGDEIIRDQIDAVCLHEFPFLSAILSPRS